MKVEVVVLGSQSLRSLWTLSNTELEHDRMTRPQGHVEMIMIRNNKDGRIRTQELCESRGGSPGLPVPNNLNGHYGRKATLNLNMIG